MALQVWLPLTGDLHNNGLGNNLPTLSNTQGSFISEGKLGKCLKTTTSGDISLKYTPNINTGNLSISAWVKFNKAEIQAYLDTLTYTDVANYATGNLIGNTSYGGIGLIWRSNNIYTSGAFSEIQIFSTLRTSTVNYSTNMATIDFDKWTHVCLTWSQETRQLSFYKNGTIFSYTNPFNAFSDAVSRELTLNWKSIYGGNGPAASIPFCINDIRIYDHALSTKEVKELSKGLVAHYTLSSRYLSENLIINGFGELGSENWTSSTNISTTEIPSGDSRIKASFYNGNQTKDYIPINPTHTYTMSGYIKSSGATSGNTYPSIFPYDIDKKFINYYNSTIGFSTTWSTTLAQPLKKGDTVVYATDLSSWSTADNNYYYHVAIFGYKDSHGNVYKDFSYTADSPSFGSYSDKSHINKTNNTITLNSPFTGEDRPAGTKICQATEGSTYYYPWGGIALSSIPDWTFKTKTFTPCTDTRLNACRYVTWSTYQNCYIAGNLLVDNTDTDRTVYDSSGYNYHGKNYNAVVSSNSPRNSISTFFDGSTSYIEMINLTFMPTLLPSEWTMSFWVYNNDAGDRSIIFSNFGLGGVGGVSFGFEKSTGELLRVAYNNGTFDRTIPNSTMTVGAWTFFAVSKTTAHEVKVYRNGTLIDTYTNSNCISNGIIYRFGSDTRTDSTRFKGGISDFRIYGTVLTADDVKELYQTGASIDNKGNIYAYELREL